MDAVKLLNWRYTTKSFDPNKKIPQHKIDQLKSVLQLCPSSVNLQPWHFIIAESEEGKKRIAKGTDKFYDYNAPKILNASHVVLFCSRVRADKDYQEKINTQEEKDGRYPNEKIKQGKAEGRAKFAENHQFQLKDESHWLEKQVYINLGNFLLSVASLEIDACPMEGFTPEILDKEFNLREKGYTASVIVSLGYRQENDYNQPQETPKSRLPQSDLFTLL